MVTKNFVDRVLDLSCANCTLSRRPYVAFVNLFLFVVAAIDPWNHCYTVILFICCLIWFSYPSHSCSYHISVSLHPPCQSSQPRTSATVCQVWIDTVLAELSACPLLDLTQIFSHHHGSRDQSECELCNNSDGRHWQVFGLGGIWPIPPLRNDSFCRIIQCCCKSGILFRNQSR